MPVSQPQMPDEPARAPAGQAWFHSPEWQAGEHEAQDQLARGEGDYYGNDEDLLSSFAPAWPVFEDVSDRQRTIT